MAFEHGGSGIPVVVGTAHWLGHDAVDDSLLLQVFSRELEGLGRLLSALAHLEQNSRAALWHNHRITGVLQHQDPVADRDANGTATEGLANDSHDNGHRQMRHFVEVAGDGLGLTPLLCLNPGIGTRGIDQGQDRQFELGRHLHQAAGLAIPFWMRHAEVALLPLFEIASTLDADDHD